MKRILIVGEDALCCVLGERLVAACLPGWELAQTSIDTKGVTKLQPALARYLGLARKLYPVLCIADTDGQCAVEWLAKWLPQAHAGFVLRLAITEAESWVLADRQGFAHTLAVPLNKLPQSPDEESDPSKPGTGYNLHLGAFVCSQWDARRAAQHSPSLARAVQRLERLGVEHV
jgi:hypothetical protein